MSQNHNEMLEEMRAAFSNLDLICSRYDIDPLMFADCDPRIIVASVSRYELSQLVAACKTTTPDTTPFTWEE